MYLHSDLGLCSMHAVQMLPTIQDFNGLSRDFRCDPGIATKIQLNRAADFAHAQQGIIITTTAGFDKEYYNG